jgi:oligopeptidase B
MGTSQPIPRLTYPGSIMTFLSSTDHTPPRPERRPVQTTNHGDERTDEYAWLRERNDEVIAHLEAENTYCRAVMAPTEALQEALFGEIKARIQETDMSLPTHKGPWSYLTRTEEGKQYGIHVRRPRAQASDDTADQLLLDENEAAAGHEFFSLGTFEPSPDHSLIAWAKDTNGAEQFDLAFLVADPTLRDSTTDPAAPEVIEGTSPGVAWAASSNAVFYTTLDEQMRPYQVWRHELGTEQSSDVLVFEEPDERFYVGLGTSATDDYIMLSLSSQITSEVHLLRAVDANDASARFVLVEPRQDGVEYAVEHHRAHDGSERFFILSNHELAGFRLYTAPIDTPQRAHWSDLGLHPTTDPTNDPYPAKLDGFDVFAHHLVLQERVDALERMRVIVLDDHGNVTGERNLSFPEPVYSIWSNGNAEFDTSTYRFGYTSPVTPPTVFSEDLTMTERLLLKQQPVLNGFSSDTYRCDRFWATARDGERIPVSIVHHRDTKLDGTAPLALYGYGSYEISIDPTFSTMRLSLLDRGVVFAIAHIRGGGERGRRWYLDGKFLAKKTTFHDFIDVADSLADAKICDPKRIVARGGSAGGLLMGAVANERPDRWAGIVAEVPFVDVVTTMLDDTLPLTAIEHDEWGDPNDPQFYAYMRSYSPYDNVGAQAYPNLLATAGLNDPRVGFWEPTKWVARLRDRSTSDNVVLLKAELGAGHGGPTGRYAVWRDEAFVLAFVLSALGIS